MKRESIWSVERKKKTEKGKINNIKRDNSRSDGETKKGEGKEIFGEGKRFAERRTDTALKVLADLTRKFDSYFVEIINDSS